MSGLENESWQSARMLSQIRGQFKQAEQDEMTAVGGDGESTSAPANECLGRATLVGP